MSDNPDTHRQTQWPAGKLAAQSSIWCLGRRAGSGCSECLLGLTSGKHSSLCSGTHCLHHLGTHTNVYRPQPRHSIHTRINNNQGSPGYRVCVHLCVSTYWDLSASLPSNPHSSCLKSSSLCWTREEEEYNHSYMDITSHNLIQVNNRWLQCYLKYSLVYSWLGGGAGMFGFEDISDGERCILTSYFWWKPRAVLRKNPHTLLLCLKQWLAGGAPFLFTK